MTREELENKARDLGIATYATRWRELSLEEPEEVGKEISAFFVECRQLGPVTGSEFSFRRGWEHEIYEMSLYIFVQRPVEELEKLVADKEAEILATKVAAESREKAQLKELLKKYGTNV